MSYPAVLECKKPATPDHGSLESLDVRVGGQALFHCDPGFTLKGIHMATCLHDGSWSTPLPYCGKRLIEQHIKTIATVCEESSYY